MKYFIDSHCHFFNIDSVPIYSTLTRLPLGTIAIGTSLAGPFLPGLLKKLIGSYKGFISYFERDIETNIQRVTQEALDCPLIPQAGYTKIFTPLIMDFEEANGNERLVAQVRNLREGIKLSQQHLTKNNIKILPFLGVDLRRLEDDPSMAVDHWFDVLLNTCGITIKPKVQRNNFKSLENGDFIGIKLYPSLGFQVFPDNSHGALDRQLAFFKLLQQRQIPITVHCQEDSFKQGEESDKALVEYGNPKQWLKVLESEGLHDLTINFAHLGGEQEVSQTIIFNYEEDDLDGIPYPPYSLNKETWSWNIIKMLKKYPNTYSDISAFDYEDERATFSLAWLLSIDHTGGFDTLGNFKLADKLLWGSDYPMMLKNISGYVQLYTLFYKTMKISDAKFKGYKKPVPTIDRDSLVENLTSNNPKKFLLE